MFLPSFSLLVGGQDKVSDLFTSFVSVSPLPLEKLLPGSDVGNGDCYRGQSSLQGLDTATEFWAVDWRGRADPTGRACLTTLHLFI